LKTGGAATICLPCDLGISVRIARSMTTARKASRLGFESYSLVIAKEHVNYIGGLLTILKFIFRPKKVTFKLRLFYTPCWNLNGYVKAHIESGSIDLNSD
jgi:hypothetical protein